MFEQIVFLQDDEAKEALSILDEKGERETIEFMKQWHNPDAHEVRDESSAGFEDECFWQGNYCLSYNTSLRYIGLEYKTYERK